MTSSPEGGTAERPSCSTVARSTPEPLAGTATEVSVWIAVEDPGPYPRKAVPDALPELLARWVADAGKQVRLQLIRRPQMRVIGAVEPDAPSRGRAVFVAHAASTPAWVAVGELDDIDDIADWDAADLVAGRVPTDLHREPAEDVEPRYLVCANGRRDPCCATHGRRALADLLTLHPGRVWETTHIGGHRLAPVVVRLPDGFMFGGPLATTESTAACRGRSALSPRAQVAELAVLQRSGDVVPRPLRVTDHGDRLAVVDGPRRWSVSVVEQTLATWRPKSCGADDEPVSTITAVAVHHLVGQDGPTPTTEPQ